MASLAGILAGSRILADLIAAVAPNAAFKGADELLNTSTTLQNDDALFLPLLANSTYVFVGIVFFTGPAAGTGDIKVAFNWPSGATVNWGSAGNSTALAAEWNAARSATGASGQVSFGSNGGASLQWFIFAGTAVVGSTPGNLQMEWAQNTSNAANTTVKAGSVMLAWQVG